MNIGQDFMVPELESTSGEAFDWLSRELELPDESTRQALREAFIRLRNAPSRKAAKELKALWPASARWPSGEAWLKSEECQRKESLETLLMLLHVRFCRVAHRIFRYAQVRSIIHPESPSRVPSFTHAILNRHCLSSDNGANICGVKVDHVVPISVALHFMGKLAHKHPECDCTVDPFKE